MRFHCLRVSALERQSNDEALLVTLEVPEELKETFAWSPGQHLTVEVETPEGNLRRAYSICASQEAGDPLRLGIKRVSGGRVSNLLHDGLQVGGALQVAPPFGEFVLAPDPRARRTHYFFAAGSGITPVYAMIRGVLAAEPYSVAWLFYGNRDAKHTMFEAELHGLGEAHGERFAYFPVHSQPSLWASSPWRSGIIDDAAVGAAIDACPPEAMDTQYWICGPGSMNRDVAAALRKRDVPSERILFESFGGDAPDEVEVSGVAAELVVAGATVQVQAGETLLQGCRRSGVSVPYSCESGACGACRGQLQEGRVEHRLRMALSDDEIDRGAVLLCQAVPTSPKVRVKVKG